MQKIKKIALVILSFSALVFAGGAKAVCPVCVVAVGAGLGISRWLGVDDLVSGLWIGGLLQAVSIWTIIWLKKKNWDFKFYKAVTWLSYYILVLLPMYYYGLIGLPNNRIFGADKILAGIIIGTAIFLACVWLNEFLKTKNQGKVYFPYQKVAIPFGALIVISLIISFLI